MNRKTLLQAIALVPLLAAGTALADDPAGSPTEGAPGRFPPGNPQGVPFTDRICVQVVVAAIDPQTGACQEFPTPCDVPEGWQRGGPNCRVAARVPVGFDNACPGGGSRTVTGGLDSETGEVSLNIELDGCVARNGVIATGSTSLTGTIDVASGAFDVLETVNVSYITPEHRGHPELTSQRSCEIRRTGSYDPGTEVFTGTVSRSNCTVSGQFHDGRGLVEHLLKGSTRDEEDIIPVDALEYDGQQSDDDASGDEGEDEGEADATPAA